MAVLVSGGAGYVGCHVARRLLAAGYDVVILDDLSRGHAEAARRVMAPHPGRAALVQGDVGDVALVRDVVRRFGVDAAVHLAARSLVGESVKQPALYYRENVAKGLALLEALLAAGVRRFVLSSTAAVYGEPSVVPIPEEHPVCPNNPYGESKAFLEMVLRRYEASYGLRFVSLRYFNAAGAEPGGDLGEDHSPETHLVPLVLQAALGLRETVDVYGGDYPTPDGTAVRDYVHVVDLAEAHVLALQYLAAGGPGRTYNLGNQRGYSVLEVLRAAERVTRRSIPYRVVGRRPGDPAVLVASSQRAREELGWRPVFEDLDAIIATAWRWHSAHPGGYGDGGAAAGP